MSDDPRAGELPGDDDLIDVDALIAAYHDERPDPSEETQRVSFGTSGHRGEATARTFNEAHVLAIAEARARPALARGARAAAGRGGGAPPHGGSHRRPALPRPRHFPDAEAGAPHHC